MSRSAPSTVEENLPRVERIVEKLVRRKRMSPDDAEEFAAHVRLKLVEDGGELVRQYRGDSSLDTYLTTVVTRLYLDYRRARWGRWRPSAAAKRRGPVAVRLERLLHRDRVPFDQAAEMLRRNHGVEKTVAELAEVAGELPPPSPSARRQEQEPEDGGLERIPAGADPAGDGLGADRSAADRRVADREQHERSRRTEAALREVLEGLDHVDRFLVRSLTSGLKVSEVSRMLGEEQKPLYRRRERLLVHLRRELEERGVTAGDVADLLDWGQAEMDAGLDEELDKEEAP